MSLKHAALPSQNLIGITAYILHNLVYRRITQSSSHPVGGNKKYTQFQKTCRITPQTALLYSLFSSKALEKPVRSGQYRHEWLQGWCPQSPPFLWCAKDVAKPTRARAWANLRLATDSVGTEAVPQNGRCRPPHAREIIYGSDVTAGLLDSLIKPISGNSLKHTFW